MLGRLKVREGVLVLVEPEDFFLNEPEDFLREEPEDLFLNEPPPLRPPLFLAVNVSASWIEFESEASTSA